jgi:hypothetical protein
MNPAIMAQAMGQPQPPAGGLPGGQGMPTPGGAMPGQSQTDASPAGSPTAQPQEKKGLKAAAMSNIHIAQNMLEQSLTAFSPEDKEYKVILKCLNHMAPLAGQRDNTDLVPAEVMRMVNQLPQMGGGSDVQKMILQQMKNPQGQQAPGQHPPSMPSPMPGG